MTQNKRLAAFILQPFVRLAGLTKLVFEQRLFRSISLLLLEKFDENASKVKNNSYATFLNSLKDFAQT